MRVYLVGGYVRDLLLTRELGYSESQGDRDWVVVGATPQQMLEKGFKPVGKDFPVFLHPDTHEEYALARTERKIGPGYHGFTFHTSQDVTLEEDLKRRDLTINAMALDGEKLIDPYGGLQDIRAKLLRHVSDAFKEDPVRILRIALMRSYRIFLLPQPLMKCFAKWSTTVRLTVSLQNESFKKCAKR